MGIIKRGILGGFSKSVGPVVGSSWKGIAVMKAKPLSVANPKTAAQQAQRNKFAQAVAAGQALLAGLITTFWNPFAEKMSGFNFWISRNIDAFDASGLTDASKINLGTSSKHPAVGLAIVANDGADDVDFTWTDNTGEEGSANTDLAVLVAYNENDDKWFYSETAVQRDAAAATLAGVTQAAGDTIYAFLSFQNADNEVGGTDDANAVSA